MRTDTRNKLVRRLWVLFLCASPLWPCDAALALGWWEDVVVFENRLSGEYKRTYKMLYRLDIDPFRDALTKYAAIDGIPNDAAFRNWKAVYRRQCDRDVCREQWSLGSADGYFDLQDMSASDLTILERCRVLLAILPIELLAKLAGVLLLLVIAVGSIWTKHP